MRFDDLLDMGMFPCRSAFRMSFVPEACRHCPPEPLTDDIIVHNRLTTSDLHVFAPLPMIQGHENPVSILKLGNSWGMKSRNSGD
jgi:hypothetical protein